MIINNEDCGTEEGIWVSSEDDIAGQPFNERIYGRLLAERVIDPETGEVIGEHNDMINKDLSRRITKLVEKGVKKVKVRSPLLVNSYTVSLHAAMAWTSGGQDGKSWSAVV
jgi:DNA-directed RNA polymerase subunit beta'